MSAARRRPPRLGDAGKRAWDRAIENLTEPEIEQFGDVAERFARQVDVADELRRAWERLKRPTLVEGVGGRSVTHPLIASMRQVDATIATLARALRLAPAAAAGAGRSGRPAGATSAPDRQPAPAPPRILRRVG